MWAYLVTEVQKNATALEKKTSLILHWNVKVFKFQLSKNKMETPKSSLQYTKKALMIEEINRFWDTDYTTCYTVIHIFRQVEKGSGMPFKVLEVRVDYKIVKVLALKELSPADCPTILTSLVSSSEIPY